MRPARGGTDTPLDGELGVGEGETRITRIRTDATRIRMNHNDVPVPLSFSEYFNGDGSDLTIWLQILGQPRQGLEVTSALRLCRCSVGQL